MQNTEQAWYPWQYTTKEAIPFQTKHCSMADLANIIVTLYNTNGKISFGQRNKEAIEAYCPMAVKT